MRVADLQKVSKIDDSIQDLLSDLQLLYAERRAIVDVQNTPNKSSAKSIDALLRDRKISLDGIDLSI